MHTEKNTTSLVEVLNPDIQEVYFSPVMDTRSWLQIRVYSKVAQTCENWVDREK